MDKNNIFYEGQVLWAQLDPNRHLRHSAYADFGAQARINMLSASGLSANELAKQNIGPILFREELFYHREIGLNDKIYVTVELTKYHVKKHRFSFRHVIYRADGVKAATILIDGAWLDLVERKLTTIPEEWNAKIQQVPKAEDYIEVSE
ncbi:acyl-CoA thioesterase [Sphingobacterium psychroaquaticum]|uniref:Acyl-CoA thioester hydrolase n=1 Tax=Sphingobacterium psychroaquaticum TaxID=561061 RepID=A0A1X7HVS3_9SPHI|nr:acyl-CoA thioesterase [Sphingobacterium psychroaquaticum]SMG05691.1 acyl-CoA thioester hydrolase [Sphingobacterium psychroaquaticum]